MNNNKKFFANILTGLILPLVIIGAAVYPAAYIFIALKRLSYPFELEWMEGGAVIQVQRILDGLPLYDKPSLEFISYIYPPLYFFVSAAAAFFLGNGFFSLRLVSFISSLGCFVFIYLITRRKTSSVSASFIAVCFFAAAYRITGAWFDVARVDSLFLLFMLAGIYAFETPNFYIRNYAAPAFLFLSFFTKQTAFVIAFGLSLAVILTRKRFERFLFPVIFGALAILSFFVMNAFTAGWYGYYVFDLLSQHATNRYYLSGFWIDDVIRHAAIALCFCFWTFLNGGQHLESKIRMTDTILLGSLLLTSFFSRIHIGGYDNVLMPVYAGIAIYFGKGFMSAMKAIGRIPSIRLVLGFAAGMQFLSLGYAFNAQIPSALDKLQGEKIFERVAGIQGEIYWADHPWYLKLLGKPTCAQETAIIDVARAANSGEWTKELVDQMRQAVVEGKYEAFILDAHKFSLKVPEFDARYKLQESELSGRFFRPVTGARRRPTFIYIKQADETEKIEEGIVSWKQEQIKRRKLLKERRQKRRKAVMQNRINPQDDRTGTAG